MKPMHLVAGAMLVACISANNSSIASDRKPHLNIDNFSWDFSIGQSLNDLKQLGKPIEEKITFQKNKYENTKEDEIRELQYKGLYIRVMFPAKDYSRMLIEQVVISNNEWKMTNGIRIGDSKDVITTLLGPPYKREDNHVMYQGGRNPVFFYFKNGILTLVQWFSYID